MYQKILLKIIKEEYTWLKIYKACRNQCFKANPMKKAWWILKSELLLARQHKNYLLKNLKRCIRLWRISAILKKMHADFSIRVKFLVSSTYMQEKKQWLLAYVRT